MKAITSISIKLLFLSLLLNISISNRVDRAVCSTTKGDFEILIEHKDIPIAAKRLVDLIKEGFFTNTAFHHVTPNYMACFGIPEKPFRHVNHWSKTPINHEHYMDNHVKTFDLYFYEDITKKDRKFMMWIALAPIGYLKGEQKVANIVSGQDVILKLNSEYTDEPDIDRILDKGNDYLKKKFPNLDYIKSCSISTKPGDNPHDEM